MPVGLDSVPIIGQRFTDAGISSEVLAFLVLAPGAGSRHRDGRDRPSEGLLWGRSEDVGPPFIPMGKREAVRAAGGDCGRLSREPDFEVAFVGSVLYLTHNSYWFASSGSGEKMRKPNMGVVTLVGALMLPLLIVAEAGTDRIHKLDGSTVDGTVLRVTENAIEVDPEGEIPFIIVPRAHVRAIAYPNGQLVTMNEPDEEEGPEVALERMFEYVENRKSPALAAVLPWLLTTLGHGYAETWLRGVPFLALRLTGGILWATGGDDWRVAGPFVVLSFTIWESVDAYNTAKRYNRTLRRKITSKSLSPRPRVQMKTESLADDPQGFQDIERALKSIGRQQGWMDQQIGIDPLTNGVRVVIVQSKEADLDATIKTVQSILSHKRFGLPCKIDVFEFGRSYPAEERWYIP